MPSLQPVSEIHSATIDRTPALAGLLPGSALLRAILLLMLSLTAIGIDGYHPYSEDAGIYVASIELVANPGIFGSSRVFVAPYLRISVFSRFNAWLCATLHLPLAWLLFGMQIATTWLLLYACLGVARRCFPDDDPEGPAAGGAKWAAVMLAAVCLSVPVAGSSLFMMDPYLTSRSFSTPLSLLAICACLDRRMLRAAVFFALGALFHPLMSIYSLGFILLLWAVIRRSRRAIAGLIATAIVAGAVLRYAQRNVVESPAYKAAVVTRYYFFLYRWQWYELLGVIAPLLLLSGYAYWQRSDGRREIAARNSVALAQACVLTGVTSIAVSLLYARPGSNSHFISALQPIRPFLYIYFCMFILLGGVIGRYLLRQRTWAWIALFASATAGIAMAQHLAFPASAQVEPPWVASTNGWNRAFVWIRDNTPADAIIALDADYIHAPGEDGQVFRAIGQRNAIADRAKDGGAAAIFPQLADRWMSEQTAGTNLNRIDDAERLRRLRPFNVSWIVIERSAATAFACPFQDDLAKVCRLQ